MKKRWKNKGARAAWIYYQLRLKEISAAGLGRGMNPPVSRRVMSYVISGSDLLSAELTRRVQEAVAGALGMKFEELWGKAPRPEPGPEPGKTVLWDETNGVKACGGGQNEPGSG